MQIVIKGKNLHITPAIKENAEKRVLHLKKYFDHVDESHVTLSVERNWHIADVTLKAGGLVLRGEERSHDTFTAVDLAVEKIERQLIRHKEKLYGRSRELMNRAPLASSGPSLFGEPGNEPVEHTTPEIVRTKRFAMKPMSPEEAALQLDLLGHDFYVFTNAETEQVSVLYRRKDGNLGVIEPVG